MKVNNIYKEIINSLSGNQSSFIPGDFYFLPNRFFIPEGVFQTTCEGKNLNFLGCQTSQITAGSISFSEDEAIISTFGEFVERYCGAFQSQQSENIIENISYNELAKKHSVLSFQYLQLYKESQYNSNDFPYTPISIDTPLDWVKAYCHVTCKEIYVPCDFVFLPYNRSVNTKNYWDQTSTGMAAHTSAENAIKGGYLECEERNAFCKWWYLQEYEIKNQIKYTQEEISSYYEENESIQKLFNTDRVQIVTYDLGKYSNVETIVCFLTFYYKEKEYIAIGCSSRLEKEDAIVKACLEAYQGIDYAILLCNKENWLDGADINFDLVNGFDKHYAFYNLYPDLRNNIPLYKHLRGNQFSSIKIFSNKTRIFNLDYFTVQSNIPHLISVDLTTVDVKSIGFEVHRVIVPGFHLLTGSHKTPFLGFFEKKYDLFTHYPHPFP